MSSIIVIFTCLHYEAKNISMFLIIRHLPKNCGGKIRLTSQVYEIFELTVLRPCRDSRLFGCPKAVQKPESGCTSWGHDRSHLAGLR
jgi:hypothetical protein